MRPGVVLLLLALLWSDGLAQPARRYSGRVERVELADGLVVVEELAEKGRRVVHAIHVDAETPIVSASRFRPRDMRGPNAYGEVSVALVDVLAGDFVVVESAEEDGRLVAVRITIVESRRPAGVRP